uniref:Uncharacterized protein n=1 Tax=Timema bartmani TaxID=61472 RepID=A0A7R9EXE9_9NEOP|nr:unnamed protein product [Timema bartmani]
MAHEKNLSLFVYSFRVEWLALDGALLVNNSVRVEWGGEGGTRAWCEGLPLLLEEGSGGVHTLRCVLHLLLFVVFLFLLAEGVWQRVLRTPSASPVWAVDPLVCERATGNERLSSVVGFAPPDRLPRRWVSAGPVLQRPASISLFGGSRESKMSQHLRIIEMKVEEGYYDEDIKCSEEGRACSQPARQTDRQPTEM